MPPPVSAPFSSRLEAISPPLVPSLGAQAIRKAPNVSHHSSFSPPPPFSPQCSRVVRGGSPPPIRLHIALDADPAAPDDERAARLTVRVFVRPSTPSPYSGPDALPDERSDVQRSDVFTMPPFFPLPRAANASEGLPCSIPAIIAHLVAASAPPAVAEAVAAAEAKLQGLNARSMMLTATGVAGLLKVLFWRAGGRD